MLQQHVRCTALRRRWLFDAMEKWVQPDPCLPSLGTVLASRSHLGRVEPWYHPSVWLLFIL